MIYIYIYRQNIYVQTEYTLLIFTRSVLNYFFYHDISGKLKSKYIAETCLRKVTVSSIRHLSCCKTIYKKNEYFLFG